MMQLWCTSVIMSEFSELARSVSVSIEQDMRNCYAGDDFGGGLDDFAIGIYITYFESASLREDAVKNHGLEWYEDELTKEVRCSLGVVVVVDPDLARAMTPVQLKNDVINKIFHIFDHFDIETPATFDVGRFYAFLRSCLQK